MEERERSGVHTGLMVSSPSSKKSWDPMGHDHPFLLSTHQEAGLRRRSKPTGHMGPQTTRQGLVLLISKVGSPTNLGASQN